MYTIRARAPLVIYKQRLILFHNISVLKSLFAIKFSEPWALEWYHALISILISCLSLFLIGIENTHTYAEKFSFKSIETWAFGTH